MENDTTIPFGIQVPEPSDLAPYLGRGIDLSTFGGKMSVRWDPDARVTSVAGLAHFGTFPANVGLFDRMAEGASSAVRPQHLTSSHSENAFIRRALDTVAAFFVWMSSNAEQLKPDMRCKVVLAYVFRLLLIPEPSLRALVPI